MFSRYEVVNSSVTGHCCFKYSVVDKEKPWLNDEGELIQYEVICECFKKEDAEMVAMAMNEVW